MKQIMGYFGGTIVAILSAVSVMGIVSFVPEKMGQIAEPIMVMKQPTLGENDAFLEYHKTPTWEVFVQENYYLQAGISYEVADLFTVQDSDGTECNVRITVGWHECLADAKVQLYESGTMVSFSQPGIYQVNLGCESSVAGYHEFLIRLVVNGEVDA